MYKALLRIDAHLEADTIEQLRMMVDELGVWGNHDDILFDNIEVESTLNPQGQEVELPLSYEDDEEEDE